MPSSFTALHHGGDGPPLVCLHGFTDTWRTWDLVLPELERHHEVLAPTLAGHAGGPPLEGGVSETALADAVERAMDDAGMPVADIVGNSLGGYVALQLAARGRATSVVALAPAGGWAEDDQSFNDTLDHFSNMQELLQSAAAHADSIVSSVDGRRAATRFVTTNFEHIPPDLVAHLIVGAAGCDAAGELIEQGRREGWPLQAPQITCPVRIVWGGDDKILPWPGAAARYRADWLAHADWVLLDGVGHCPQLDVPLETAQLILGFTGEPGTDRARAEPTVGAQP
jgi:pimeloyl-ACP methyl ester carboxylesterase